MPAGPAPTTATRSRGGGDGGPGSSSADTSRILTRPGGRAPGSENPESRRQPVSVVVVATITPQPQHAQAVREAVLAAVPQVHAEEGDRKSTRLNSSHANISYAVFCLKKKKKR